MTDTVDFKTILKLLPHRYPFLLVDKVLEFTPGESITAIKNVSVNEPQFMGHFPENPVMPGVLSIEAMAQSAGILVAMSKNFSGDDFEIFFMAIDGVKFRKIIGPGDQIVLKADKIQNRGFVWKFACKALVDGEVAAESLLTAMIKEKKDKK